MGRRGGHWPGLLCGLGGLLLAGGAFAAEPCAPPVAEVVSVQGAVELRRSGETRWQPADLGDPLCLGDVVRTGPVSRAGLVFANDSVLRLDQRTELRVRATADEERSLLDMILGAVQFFSRRPRALQIDTPFVNAAAEGTEFFVRVAEEEARIVMFEGRVRASNPQGEVLLASGDAAVVPRGEAPRPEVVVRPRDAVAWALYYPPVQSPLAERAPSLDALPAGLRRAVERAAENDYPGALDALDAVPETARDVPYWTYRAGVLLNVGRVEAAQAALDRALARDPEAAGALAQRAVIRGVRGQREEALADARRAVELAPDSAPARIALSYAHQARAELAPARAVLREAVERAPEDALAWARLAELELAFGDLDAAQEAAKEATALAPELGRTQMVRGFAALARIDTTAAKTAFERAIALDSASPLARLGLGLARIRESDLDGGRREIEIAAGLDPSDALVRSYLGKAYFEERREEEAGTQFEIAKQLDPNDPTPYFYDAIKKQLENRPVEALHDLQTSIRLNDNRAVYRSRLLLDRDLATRSVSLARIYDDLGFDEIARIEASKSLGLEPSNWSAHRFLSDAAARLPRHEIARASELLQAQLLQPININPIQPGAVVDDLNVVAGLGPAEGAFNEFHPLFERENAQVTATGLAGNNDTYGGEGVLDMVFGRASLSLAGLHTETDGFRANNDVENQIAEGFAQVAVTPEINVQAEYRLRDTEQGDLRLDFDPDVFDENRRRGIEQETARVGLRFSPSTRSHLLVSLLYSDRDEDQIEEDPLVVPPGVTPPILRTDIDTRDEGLQGEVRYLFDAVKFNVTAGAGAYDIDVDQDFDDLLLIPGGPALPLGTTERSFEREQVNVYVYGDINIPSDVIWTLGLGYDSYEEETVDVDEVTPKFGVQWQATDKLLIRAAAMRTVKRALVVDQTLEPTEVAGFNQFFDDLNGTTAERYGIGLDFTPKDNLFLGFEYSRRDRDVRSKIVDGGAATGVAEADQNEDLYVAYAYWAPFATWVLDAEVRYDDFDSEATRNPDIPSEVDTLTAPLVVRYFSPTGFFAQAGPTLVYQEVERRPASSLPDGDDTFVLVDAALGYRLPKRYGIASLEVRNLFDTDFKFQDDNFRTNEVRSPMFFPERTVLGRITLTF